ncbi:MAG: 50S ribosome-binding GTPase [Candidatus Saganbacteria bacterium]|nr:50S ribosome-binding GTPase [Candidatus Saganbacteria bacterium]
MYADNKLFATLDPTTRRVILPNEQEILITDTVGFIQKLPHQLIEAFRATLEEVTEADILIHVVDASSPHINEQIEAVFNVLEELNAITKPIITAFNKIDRNEKMPLKLQRKFKPYVLTSALYKKGLDDLLGLISKELEKVMVVLNFAVPINEMNIVHLIHEKGKVMKEKYEEDRVLLKAKVDEITAKRLEKYIIR